MVKRFKKKNFSIGLALLLVSTTILGFTGTKTKVHDENIPEQKIFIKEVTLNDFKYGR